MLITKNSNEAKLTKEEVNLSAKVIEKGFNDLSEKNQEFTNKFSLDNNFEYLELAKLGDLSELDNKHFAKGNIQLKCSISVDIFKSNAFMRLYVFGNLVMKIKMSEKQLDSIEDKFNTDMELHEDGVPKIEYTVFIGGVFRKEEESLQTKLEDLRLFKVIDMIYV